MEVQRGVLVVASWASFEGLGLLFYALGGPGTWLRNLSVWILIPRGSKYPTFKDPGPKSH